jgi:hypothetical protein
MNWTEDAISNNRCIDRYKAAQDQTGAVEFDAVITDKLLGLVLSMSCVAGMAAIINAIRWFK